MANRHEDTVETVTLPVTVDFAFKLLWSDEHEAVLADGDLFEKNGERMSYCLLFEGESVEDLEEDCLAPPEIAPRLLEPMRRMYAENIRLEWVSADEFRGPPGTYHVTLSIDPEQPGDDWDLYWDGKIWEVHQTPSTKRVVWVRAPRDLPLPERRPSPSDLPES